MAIDERRLGSAAPPASASTTPDRTGSSPAGPGSLGAILSELLGPDLPVRIECYDGTALGPPDAPARLTIQSREALRYVLTAPGELGFARAFVQGELDVDGDIFDALALLRDRLPNVRLRASQWLALARLAGAAGLWPLPPAPQEEARLRGPLHSKERDAAAISHHYDVSNAFYRVVLGPTMTYSCAVWSPDASTLEQAQTAKYELVAAKLALRPGMRLLDVGCGWGGMVLHAARHYGVDAVGITLSREQAAYARDAVRDAGLDDRIEIRYQDYRDVRDGPFDAISSIGMFEHVGLERLDEYFACLYALLPLGGRVLNHGISTPTVGRLKLSRRSFVGRYVFPDGELHEVGTVVTHLQKTGFEVRHVESLREHYARTLRAWVANLESNWDAAVAEVGPGRARVWRLYMAASALNFEANRTQIHQVLGVRSEEGPSGFPARPDWDTKPLV